MNWNKPIWYITPQEFANVVVEALEQSNHFKKNESVHPEDLVIAFVAHAEAVALGMGFAGRKFYESQKEAVMKTKDLRKNALPIDDEIAPFSENGLNYSESKYKIVINK